MTKTLPALPNKNSKLEATMLTTHTFLKKRRPFMALIIGIIVFIIINFSHVRTSVITDNMTIEAKELTLDIARLDMDENANSKNAIYFDFPGEIKSNSNLSFRTTLCNEALSNKPFVTKGYGESPVFCNIIDKNGLLEGNITGHVYPDNCVEITLLPSAWFRTGIISGVDSSQLSLECYVETDKTYKLKPIGKIVESKIDLSAHIMGKNAWLVDGTKSPSLAKLRDNLIAIGLLDKNIKTQASLEGLHSDPLKEIHTFWNKKYYLNGVLHGTFYEATIKVLSKTYPNKVIIEHALDPNEKGILYDTVQSLALGSCSGEKNKVGDSLCPNTESINFESLASGKPGDSNVHFAPEIFLNDQTYDNDVIVIITE